MMKALVTGASGFVGTWLTRRLVESGVRVRVLSRRRDSADNPQGVDVVSGDVCDPRSLVAACEGMEIVYHLAGVVGYSSAMRAQMEQVNVGGTRHMIEAVLTTKVPRLVVMSSVTAVGASFDRVPLNESSPYNVGHLNLGYFETKHAAEKLVMDAVSTRGLNAVVVNPSTIYGPGDAKKGSRGVQVKVAQGRMPFYTHGGVSVIGIEELVEGVLAAAAKGRTGERYILSGENITIQKLFELIAQAANVSAPQIGLPNFLVHGLGQMGEVLERFGKKGPISRENAWTSTLFHWFDSQKAQKELGLKLRPAAHSIEQSVKWMKDHKII